MPSAVQNSSVQQVKSDLDSIQGAWESVAGPRDCRLLISGQHYSFEILDGDVFIGTFDLELDESPRRMNMKVAAGPNGLQDQTARCIYHIEGDVLRWCGGKPGSKCELHSFPSVHNDCFLSLVFRRARSHRAAKA